jgi:hypothetical protein
VNKVTYDGKIYLKEVESRKPPLSPIHWKSTRRLASPNLVGLVKISDYGAALADGDKILWAEIICHDFSQARFEFKRREQKVSFF